MYENTETEIVNIGGVTSTGTINDNDAKPSFTINDVTVNEGAGTATFTVTLSAASGLQSTVDYGTASSTALTGSDFTAASGTLTFAAGVTTQTITVNIINDNIYEGSESFKVNLSNATNATIADALGIGTILDNGSGTGGTDNDTPTVSIGNITVTDQTAGFAIFVVALDKASTVATTTTFSLALTAGTATGGGTDYGTNGAGNLQVSSDNGTTWTDATSATIPALNTSVLVRTPITQDNITEVSENFTLTATRTSGATTNNAVTATATITDANNAPHANSDAPTTQLQEDAATTTLSGNAILGGSGNVADADPNNDTLSITGLVAGNNTVTGATTLSSPVTANGTYGSLSILANGSYTYTLDNSRIQTQNLINGQIANDVFSYRITDGNGGYDTATITVQVVGSLDLTAKPSQSVEIEAGGLRGEYYGYNDGGQGNAADYRVHADDGTATKLSNTGTVSTTSANLNSVEDIETIINGRNVIMGGPDGIVGTSDSGATNAADVLFNVRTLNYGTTPVVSSDLGKNAAVAAGNALPAQDNISNNNTNTALANFLDQDASTAIVQTGTPTGNTVGTQTGLGRTTDAIVRMTGSVYLERGNYDFRVTGDDGYRLKIGGETLIEYDGNQAPTVRTFNNVEVSDLISGLTSI